MPRNPRWFPAAYAVVLIAQLALAAGLANAHWQQTRQWPLVSSSQHGVLAAGGEPAMQRAISELLQYRARAILDRNSAAFFRTVDPQSRRFVSAQARLFQRVIEVPFSRWDYQVRGAVSPAIGAQWLPRLQQRYGAPVWLAEVAIRHRFTSLPNFELASTHYLTFVLRAGGWRLTSDDDLDPAGLRSDRQLWDFGPVTIASSAGTLVLGHRVQQGFVQQVSRIASQARGAVQDLFKTEVAPVVVIVPADLHEAQKLLQRSSANATDRAQPVHLSTLSAVTTFTPSADSKQACIVLNTPVMVGLREPEQAAVLRHEAAHVATDDAAAGNTLPWLSEGIAEYAAYVGSGLSKARFAPDLASSVRSRTLPQQLPARHSFEVGTAIGTTSSQDAAAIGLAYRYAWSACALLVERVGFTALVELYRHGGWQTETQADPVWPRILQQRFTLSGEKFVQLWQEYLLTSFAKS